MFSPVNTSVISCEYHNHFRVVPRTAMDLLDLTSHYVAGAALLAIAIAFVLFQPTGLVKWLQKKNYQYEVTFALYMLTPTEKFIFSTPPTPKTPYTNDQLLT